MKTTTVRRRRWFSPAARSLMALTRMDDPRVAMVQRAEDLLQEAEVTRPPVELEPVASYQNVRRVEAVPMPGAGRLIPEGDGFRIQVNERHSRSKQRFSAGHEVSHTLVPSYQAWPRRVEDAVTGLFQQDQEEEYLCDLGAAELLMPMALFRPLAAAQGFSLDTLETLRHDFRASREATAIRLVQTELWPCAMAIWHEAHKPSEQARMDRPLLPGFEPPAPPKKLRVRYAVHSAGFRHYLHPNLSAEPDGCLAACFAHDEVVGSAERLVLRERYEEFFVMAAPINFDGVDGPTREVLSLVIPATVPHAMSAVQPDLWSTVEE